MAHSDARPTGTPGSDDELDGPAAFLDLLRIAPAGDAELNAQIDCALAGRVFDGLTADGGYRWRTPLEAGEAMPAARWSVDLMALLWRIPVDHDFSLGERDGVPWVWIQPHDDWAPTASESRHDHPRGSGLIVARTLPLAVAAALIALLALPAATPMNDREPA